MDNMQQNPYEEIPANPESISPSPEQPRRFAIPTGKKELTFGFFVLLCGWLMLNSIFFGGGFQLGYAIFAGASVLFAAIYLLASGAKPTFYSILLLILDLVIIGSFARSDDSFVKFIMLCFLLVSVNLSLCLTAGQNHRQPGGLTSLLDVPRTVIRLSTGKLPAAVAGLFESSRKGGSAMKKVGGALLGVGIALPLLCILIPLLMKADAAFEGLLDNLPAISAGEILVTFLFGTPFGVWLYLRGVGLKHSRKPELKEKRQRRGIGALTVNTVLIAVSAVYVVYLVSQLAYFSGGFAGILPEEYTVAEYARRGFFEMAWICAINLLVMCLAVGLCSKKNNRAPLVTRLLCLFIGLVTLFLVFAASAKMYMYIDAYGLTRLRVLTEVIMVFMALTTLTVSVWLFIPKMPYMKLVLVMGLLIGAAVAWADVDTVVAWYNVDAYQSGKLETIDMDYMWELGYGAAPYVARLAEDENQHIATRARDILNHHYSAGEIEDFRFWNYAKASALPHLPEPVTDSPA